MPVEHLAQLLLQCARADAALPRRAAANDDELHQRSVDDMYNRIEALPELRREPRMPLPLPLPPIPTVAVASNEDLEELVAMALASAQDAEDISQEANAASRRARRGMFLAVGVAALGIVIATAGTLGVRLLYRGDARQMAEISRQVRALGNLQQHINDQLAQLHVQQAVQEASAGPPRPIPSARAIAPARAIPPDQPIPPAQRTDATPRLRAPLEATVVRVLPAMPAAPQTARVAANQPPEPDPRPASYTPAAAYLAYPAASPPPYNETPRVVYERSWAPYHPPVRRYRTEVVLPQPVVYFIGSVQRDVRALFR